MTSGHDTAVNGKLLEIDTHGLVQFCGTDFIGQSVAVLGIKGGGKSNTAAVLVEELLRDGIPVGVIDVAGEYYTLKELFPRLVVVGRSLYCEVDVKFNTENVHVVAKTLYTNGLPFVFDLSGVNPMAREEMLNMFLGAIWTTAAARRIPMTLVIEEAHNWIPQRKATAVSDVLVSIATEGRKRGLGLVMVSQRSARLNKDVLSQADIYFLHRVRHPADVGVYIDVIPRPRRQVVDIVNKLKVGQAAVLVGERMVRADIRLRHSLHAGATPTRDSIPLTQLSFADLMLIKAGGQ
jgi:DNA helicase HerA-like ATPase